jgi:hypothetical protein
MLRFFLAYSLSLCQVNPNMNPIIPPAAENQNPQPAALAALLLNEVQLQRQRMEEALMRLGLTKVAAHEFTNYGINGLERLRMLSSDGLDRLIKQIHRENQGAGLFIPFFSQESIHAIHFWKNRMHILGLQYEIDQVTEELATRWNRARKAEQEAAKMISSLDMVKQPDAYKKETKWRSWKESMLTYLHSKIGHANLPLAYIVQENDVPNYDKVFNTVHDQLVECAILHGPEFNINNGLVYDLLQSLTLNGPAWSWINMYKNTRDGRNAWKSLINYYKGDSAKTRGKQECYDAISKASYLDPRQNFDFSTYVAIHQQAHQDLQRLGKPVPENKKVRDFLNGINDPQCANIKFNVLSNTIFMNDFPQTVNYIASAIDMTTKNSSTMARQISELTRSGTQNSGRGQVQLTLQPRILLLWLARFPSSLALELKIVDVVAVEDVEETVEAVVEVDEIKIMDVAEVGIAMNL